MKVTEDLIRKVTLASMDELGKDSSIENIKKIVYKTLETIGEFENADNTENTENKNGSGRFILTAFGLNKPGVVFKITQILANNECDIQDLSQKILKEFFTMIMIVDITNAKLSFSELRDTFQKLDDELNIRIFIQHEDVFKYMHRI